MNSVDLGFFYNERKLNALEKHYDGTVEGYIEYQLDILFEEIVPPEEQHEIERLNQEEEKQAQLDAEENRRFSLNHIRENGKDYYFTDEDAKSFYSAANIYRSYSRKNIVQNALPKDSLAQAHHFFKFDISEEEYEQLVNEYGDNKHIVAVLDFDLDDETARVKLNGESEWHSYMLKDISTAVFYANKNKYGNSDFKEMKFGEHLDGKEVGESFENDVGDQENNSGMQMC